MTFPTTAVDPPAPRPPECSDCGCFMEEWASGWRCPWTRTSDTPDPAFWTCGRPYAKQRNDVVLPTGRGKA